MLYMYESVFLIILQHIFVRKLHFGLIDSIASRNR